MLFNNIDELNFFISDAKHKRKKISHSGKLMLSRFWSNMLYNI